MKKASGITKPRARLFTQSLSQTNLDFAGFFDPRENRGKLKRNFFPIFGRGFRFSMLGLECMATQGPFGGVRCKLTSGTLSAGARAPNGRIVRSCGVANSSGVAGDGRVEGEAVQIQEVQIRPVPSFRGSSYRDSSYRDSSGRPAHSSSCTPRHRAKSYGPKRGWSAGQADCSSRGEGTRCIERG
jgi:hypothetical protein